MEKNKEELQKIFNHTNFTIAFTTSIVFQGYKRRNEFIITQMPLSTTKTDFWRLVEEHDVHIIVMMNNVSETEVKLYLADKT